MPPKRQSSLYIPERKLALLAFSLVTLPFSAIAAETGALPTCPELERLRVEARERSAAWPRAKPTSRSR